MCVDYIIGLATINTSIQRLVVRGLTVFGVVGMQNKDQKVDESQAYQTALLDKAHMRGSELSPCHSDTISDAISDTRLIYLYIIGKNKTLYVSTS